MAEQCQLVCMDGKRHEFSKCCLKSIWNLLKSILMPTVLTAIFKGFTAPKEGAALQGKKVEKLRKCKREEEEDRGAMAARRAGAQA